MTLDIDYDSNLAARARLREAAVPPRPPIEATELLRRLTDITPRIVLTPDIIVGLAMHLSHIAGGDGRGVFVVMHDPEGDRINGA